MAFQIRPYPEWSWSQSREQLFSECARKYYYHYYESHNGWLKDASPSARLAYRLKQITNLYLILGEAIHQMAEDAVNKWQLEKILPDEPDALRAVRDCLNQAYLDSRQIEQWQGSPKKRHMLHEIYYDGQLPGHRVEQIKKRMAACIQHWYQSASLRELAEDADIEIIEVEQLNTFLVEQEKVYVKLDLLYRKQDGTWVIVDWKTGQETEKNEQQVLLYALFLHDKYQVPIERIEIRIEYLFSGEVAAVKVRPEDVEQVKLDVLQSVQKMKDCLEHPAENIPKSIVAFPASPETRKCGGCNYREICDDKLVAFG